MRALLALALLSCSAPATPRGLVRAEALEHAGRDGDAARAYQDEARLECDGSAKRARWCAAALRSGAAALARAGKRAEAADLYERVPAVLPHRREDAAGALAAAAALRLALGADARAYDLWWRVILAYPDTAGADEALRRLVADGRQRNPRQLYGALRDLYARLAATPVADNLLWALATLAHEDLGDDAAALADCDRLAQAYPDSPLADDALWLGARLARAHHDPDGAVRRLRRLLATRETSFVIGSYFSVHLDDAQLLLARILRDDLGRAHDAVRELRRLPDDYPDSTLRDDALYEEAVTEEKLGDRAAACAAAARLRAQFPDSRYELRQAPALRARLHCPGAVPAAPRGRSEGGGRDRSAG